LAENQSNNLPAAATAEEGQSINQSINQSNASTLSSLAFVISPERCPWHNLELGKAVGAVSPKYFRPTEVELLIGDPQAKQKPVRQSLRREMLGWQSETKMN